MPAAARKRALFAALAALAMLAGCRTAGPAPSSTGSAAQSGASHTAPTEEARLAIRYAELCRLGTPEKISEEFSRETMVLNAEYFFEHSVTYGNLRLYSDLPFDQSKGMAILKGAERRLKASPIYDPQQQHLGFVCNARWLSEYFLQGANKYGGMNYISIAPRVFFAKARIEDDVVLSPRNRPITAPRTFTYYVAHEFGHSVIGKALGPDAFHELPKWLSEGYADYVALGPNFTYQDALTAYQNRDPRVRGTMAEDYMRYDVMTAYYLERKSVKVQDLLNSPPGEAQATAEAFGP